jgi:hypothetical protein
MTTRHLHLFAIGLNVALVAWGAFLIANGVEAGCGLVLFASICGSSATAALRGKGG